MSDTSEIIDIDGRATIRLERDLEHSAERVWRAVTEPAEMERWFVVPVPWTPIADETFEAFGQSGAITEFDPPNLIRWTWGDELYSIEVQQTGESSCHLTFTHAFDETYGPGLQHMAGWEIYFGRLDSFLLGNFVEELEAHVQGVFVHEDGRPVIRFHRGLDHPIERVWRAVTTPEGLGAWFPCEVEVDLRVGGAMTFTFAPDFALTGEVLALDEPNRFEFTWGDDVIRMELLAREENTKTLLSFTHVLSESDDAVSKNAAGWHVCLDALGRNLDNPEATAVEPGRTDEWQGHYNVYVNRGFPAGADIPS